jgi:hypothetical protein
MKFVGIDLTSAFAESPRPIDIAVLDDGLNARFFTVAWLGAEAVIGRDPSFLTRMLQAQVPVGTSERMVVAIDGPQGLAVVGNTMRACERILERRAARRVPYPPQRKPARRSRDISAAASAMSKDRCRVSLRSTRPTN